MLGAQYAGLLVAAQGGDEGAFATLWRDANPALSRYLRVVTAGIVSVDAGDVARESWRTAIHRLADFEGDETAWRSLLFTAAHARVEVARIGRSWGDLLPGEGLALDELSGSDDTPVDQLTAPDGAPGDSGGDGWLAPVLLLPRGEAQVLMLAVAGELPDAEIARVVGSSVSAVRDLQEAALAHLGSDRESVAQALGAPGTPAELV
jgi:RNA polymerase sigma-70 factor (ECF subfamily)